jgi:hypothetical protein
MWRSERAVKGHDMPDEPSTRQGNQLSDDKADVPSTLNFQI